MNTGNTIVPDTDLPIEKTLDTHKSEQKIYEQPGPSVPAADLPLEETLDVLDSHKSEPKIHEQPGPSVSTIDTIPVTLPKSNSIINSTDTAPDAIIAAAMKKVSGILKRKFAETRTINEQQNRKPEHLIKIACEALANDLNLVDSADQKLIFTMNSITKFYRRLGPNEITYLDITKLEAVVETLSRMSCLHGYADDYIVDTVKIIIVSIGQFIDGNIELKRLVLDIKSFVDTLRWKLKHFSVKVSNIKLGLVFDEPETGTP